MSSKLIETLSTFTSKEWSSFRKFLLSQTGEGSDNFEVFSLIFNRRNRLHTLDKLDEKRKKHFPHLTSKGFSNALSRINLWLEEWLAIYMMKSKDFEEDLLLIQAFNSRGLYDLADQKARKIIKELKIMSPVHALESKILSRLYHLQYFSDNPIKYRKGGPFYESLLQHYLIQFKEQSWLYLTEALNWGKLQQYDFSELEKPLLKLMGLFPDSELSKIYNEVYKLQKEETLEHFLSIWQKVQEGKLQEGSEGHTIIVFYLISKSLRLWGSGSLNDPDIPIRVFNYALEKGILMQGGKIPVVRFHNIISSFGLLKDYNKTKDFIDRWTPMVATKSSTSTWALAMAQNAFYNERYNEMLPLLRGIEYENYIQKGRSLCLEVIAMYMDVENTYTTLLNTTFNFKRSLKRNKSKLSKTAYQYYYNLLDVIELMAEKKYKNKEIDLTNYQYILYRSWVVKEVRKLG